MKNKSLTIIVFIISVSAAYICAAIDGYEIEKFYHCILMMILFNVIEINCKRDD